MLERQGTDPGLPQVYSPNFFAIGIENRPDERSSGRSVLRYKPNYLDSLIAACAAISKSGKLTVYVVMGIHLVHGLKHFVQINERTNNNQTTQHIPKPKVGCAEAICNASSVQFCANAVGDSMRPNDSCNTKRDRINNENQKAVMHSFLTVMS